MPNTVFSHNIRNAYVQNGMRVYFIKANDKTTLFDKCESLKESFSSLPFIAIKTYAGNTLQRAVHAVLILSARSFAVTDALFADAASAVLNGSAGELLDLCLPDDEEISLSLGL